ncbi:MAG: hypothetical protein PVH29_09710 [Candidatus Zixiibacteriota bacterium]|jgi:hypothetical protein
MKPVKICAAVFSLAMLTTFCTEDEPTTPALGAWVFYAPPYDGAWTRCTVGSDGAFWGLVQLDESGRAAIARFDGDSWSKTEFDPSVTEALNAILVFGDGSGWACGGGGALLEKRADEWILHRPYNDVDYYYLGAAGPDSVWAIGQATVYPRGYKPVVLRYDGTRWSENDAPSGYTSFGPVVVKAGNGYLVGRRDAGDEILRLSGTTWGGPTGFDRALRVHGLTAADGYAFAVGEERPKTVGRGAVYQVSPVVRDITPGLAGVRDYYYRAAYCTSEGELWVSAAPFEAGGGDYKLLYWDGDCWYEVPASNSTGNATRVFEFAFSPGGGWAVGGQNYARYREP